MRVQTRLFFQKKYNLSQATIFARYHSQSTQKVESQSGKDNLTNEELIIKIFNSESFWKKFNNGKTIESSNIFNSLNFSPNNKASVGLFRNPYLSNPKGLKTFANETLEKARALTDYMINDQSIESKKSYIKDLDRLSDMLCRVIDLCEFIRVVHPNSSFIKAAEECHYELFEHMNILNTSKPLFDKLEKVLHDKKLNIRKKLSNEEISVGNLLYADFKKSGIDMDTSTGEQFVQLSSYIANAGQEFNNNITIPNEKSIKIQPSEWSENDIKLEYLKFIKQNFDGSLTIPIYGHIPFELLRSCPNRIIREKIWVALHSVPKDQIQLLTNLLRCREILAKLMGCKNYSEYALNDKMAKNPENVISFLRGIINDLQPEILKELRILNKYFPENLNNKDYNNLSDLELVNTIKPWDREYLLTKYLLSQKSSQNEDITKYFSLGTVVSGLSKLFHSIYGIQLVPQKLNKGEVWSSDVRRFDAIHDKDGKVGIMYLDLLQRRGKTPHPAHFTICCSRKLDEKELDLNDPFNLSKPTISTVETVKQNNKTYQLPVISLVCNYHPDVNNGNIVFLTLDQVATLFHEMGHAMHSMLGRTELHNVSGTRCQTDFVELPSILHETFARDKRVLTSFGKHFETGDNVSIELVEKHLDSDKILSHLETFGQVKMALLDQLYHGATNFEINNESFDLINIYHELESNLGILADTKSSWPGKFGHLYSYGALYYSYLLDRAIASKIWDKLFENDPFSRDAGEKFKNEILKWGGSRDPWICISKVLNIEELANGDVNSMKIISKDSGKKL
jgi:intermediate peptidase